MILVDTSVLVDYLTGRSTPAVGQLDTLIERQSAFYLTPQVVQEVLQGARDAAQWRKLRQYLAAQMWVDVKQPLASHVAAARIYFDCRRAGLTVRSAADCLIAQTALEHGFALLHDDRDFDAIRRVRPLATLP